MYQLFVLFFSTLPSFEQCRSTTGYGWWTLPATLPATGPSAIAWTMEPEQIGSRLILQPRVALARLKRTSRTTGYSFHHSTVKYSAPQRVAIAVFCYPVFPRAIVPCGFPVSVIFCARLANSVGRNFSRNSSIHFDDLERSQFLIFGH